MTGKKILAWLESWDAERERIAREGWYRVDGYDAPPVILERLGFLLDTLPPVIARRRVDEIMGGVVTGKALANADCAGTGPRVRFRAGRDVFYPTIYLLEWLEHKGVDLYARS